VENSGQHRLPPTCGVPFPASSLTPDRATGSMHRGDRAVAMTPGHSARLRCRGCRSGDRGGQALRHHQSRTSKAIGGEAGRMKIFRFRRREHVIRYSLSPASGSKALKQAPVPERPVALPPAN
jgi:hypothetical protein